MIGSDEVPVYALLLEVAVQPGTTGAALEDDLAALKQELGVEITVNEIDSDIL